MTDSDPTQPDPRPTETAPAAPPPPAPATAERQPVPEPEPFDFAENGATGRDERAALRGSDTGGARDRAPLAHPEPPRRGFFRKLLAVVVGGIVTAVPAAAGLAVFFDPVRRARKAARGAGAGAATGAAAASGEPGGFVRVAQLDAVPADGRPAKFQVIADRVDAWTKYRNVPLGAVYLKRVDAASGSPAAGGSPAPKVVAWNVVCPHAGCFVDVAADGRNFRCPCHNSGFKEDGSLAPGSVSPRPMDELEVDPEALGQGVVRVRYQDFYAGTHEKMPKN